MDFAAEIVESTLDDLDLEDEVDCPPPQHPLDTPTDRRPSFISKSHTFSSGESLKVLETKRVAINIIQVDEPSRGKSFDCSHGPTVSTSAISAPAPAPRPTANMLSVGGGGAQPTPTAGGGMKKSSTMEKLFQFQFLKKNRSLQGPTSAKKEKSKMSTSHTMSDFQHAKIDGAPEHTDHFLPLSVLDTILSFLLTPNELCLWHSPCAMRLTFALVCRTWSLALRCHCASYSFVLSPSKHAQEDFPKFHQSVLSFIPAKDIACAIKGSVTTDLLIKVVKSPKINRLQLIECGLDDKSVGSVASVFTKNKTLKTLKLDGHTLSDQSVRTLAKSLSLSPSLSEITIQRQTMDAIGVQKLCKHFSKISALKAVHFVGFKAPPESLSHLSLLLPKLQKLSLSGHPIGLVGMQNLCAALKGNSTLSFLDLNGCGMQDKGAMALADALMGNKTLGHLDISGNLLTDTAIELLAPSIGQLSSLCTLKLALNNISQKGAVALAREMKGNQLLTCFNISLNPLYDEGAEVIASFLASLPFLSHIEIFDVKCRGDRGGKTLIGALAQSTALKHIHIGGCGVGMTEHGTGHLISLIERNKDLAHLDLTSNKIGPSAISLLAPVLSSHPSIQTLVLFGNELGPEGAALLSPHIAHMRHLSTLNIGMCGLEESGSLVIAQAVLQNDLVAAVNFAGNRVRKGVPHIQSLLSSHPRLALLDVSENGDF